MKEKEVLELFDYVFMIWKRKILILVMTLVCIIMGVIISLRFSETYISSALIRIGQGITTTEPVPLEEPKNLVSSLPLEYGMDIGPDYDIRVDMQKGTPLIRIFVEGAEKRKTIESLKIILERLIENHGKLSEGIINSYRVLAKGVGEYIEVIGEDMAQFALTEKRIKDKGINAFDTIYILDSLRSRRINLDAIKREAEYKIQVNSLRINRTKVVGGIETKKKYVVLKKVKCVIASGIIGLSIAIFLSCFMFYLTNVRSEHIRRRL